MKMFQHTREHCCKDHMMVTELPQLQARGAACYMTLCVLDLPCGACGLILAALVGSDQPFSSSGVCRLWAEGIKTLEKRNNGLLKVVIRGGDCFHMVAEGGT